jgi:hypothetical protein
MTRAAVSACAGTGSEGGHYGSRVLGYREERRSLPPVEVANVADEGDAMTPAAPVGYVALVRYSFWTCPGFVDTVPLGGGGSSARSPDENLESLATSRGR